MKNQKGFSLIGILIALAVMGALFVTAAPYIVEIRETALAVSTRVSYEAITDACLRYNQDTSGEWPTDLFDLVKDPSVNGWTGPYLSVSRLKSSWGGDVTLEQDTTVFKIGNGSYTTDTDGKVLYLQILKMHNMAARKLDVLVDGEYDIAKGLCQFTTGATGATVKLLVYDIAY